MSNTTITIGGLDTFSLSATRLHATTDETFELLGGQGVNIELVEFVQLLTLDGIPGLGRLTDKLSETLSAVKKAQAEISKMQKAGDSADTILKALKTFPNTVVRSIAKASDLGEDLVSASLDLISFDLKLLRGTLTPIYIFLETTEKVTDAAKLFEKVREPFAEVVKGERDAWSEIVTILDEDFSGLNATAADAAFEIDTTEAFEAFAARVDAREAKFATVNQLTKDFTEFLLSIVPDGVEDIVQWMIDEMNAIVAKINDVLDLIDFDVFDSLFDVLAPITSSVSILQQVEEAVQPVIDFFGPVTDLINEAVESVEDALGLSTLENRVRDAINDALESVLDPLRDSINSATEDLQALFDDIEALFDELVGLVQNFIQEIGELATSSPIDVTSLLNRDNAPDKQIIGGSEFADFLVGSIDADATDGFGALISGGAGDDLIIGTDLKDLLNGGADNDLVRGGGGDDKIFGGSGENSLEGGAGDDQIAGGDETDVISGDEGNDSLAGFGGADLINGNDGDDLIDGGAGGDVLRGGLGNDTLLGGADADILYSGYGENLLDGQGGLDVISTAGRSDAVHRITDLTSKLIGGSGKDIVDLADALQQGAIVAGGVEFDGGGNTDRLEVGNFDSNSFGTLFENFETLQVGADNAEIKTLWTSADAFRPFDTLSFDGDGDFVIDVTNGALRMDALFDDRPFLFDFSGIRSFDNPQDGPAGTRSSMLALTVALSDPSGGFVQGIAALTDGINFLGGSGNDTIIGGGGSDIINGGLGADVLSGGPSDSGDRFDTGGAVGDVIQGTPEELDGDLILDLSNRVDRVRVLGNDLELEVVEFEGNTLVTILESSVATASFTIEGVLAKPRIVTESGYVEIFNNNVLPTAVAESYDIENEGGPVPIDPFENDFDVDTEADADARVERREIAYAQSVELLLADVDVTDDDAMRLLFESLGVGEGGSVETKLGNRIDIVANADGSYDLSYIAAFPDLVFRPFRTDDAITTGTASAENNYDVTEDLPFFGRDTLEYVVYDNEGEVSNITTVDFLIRPSETDNSFVVRGVDWQGDPIAATATAELEARTDGTGAKRISFSSDLNETLQVAIGANDYFDISAIRPALPDEFAYFGFSGNDYLDGRGVSDGLFLLGGNNADLVEGGLGNDFLSGGGLDDEIIAPNMRVDVDGEGREDPNGTDYDEATAPNILIGGAGQNVFSASVDHPTSGIDREFTASRETIHVLDRDGADIITGPMVAVGQSTASINIDILPTVGPTALAAAALDNDTIVGFDGNSADLGLDYDYDQILLPLDPTAFQDTYVDPSGEFFFEISSDASASLPRFAEVYAPFLRPTGLSVVGTSATDSQQILDDAGLQSVFVLESETQPLVNPPFDFMIGEVPEADLNRVITYDVVINDPDIVNPDGFTGSVNTTYTTVTVTLNAYDVLEEYRIVELPSSDPDFANFELQAFRTLIRDDDLIDPLDLDGAEGLTFTFQLDGTFRDRFVVDLAEIDVSSEPSSLATSVLTAARGQDDTAVRLDAPAFDAAALGDAYLGLSFSYVSAPAIGNADAESVARGNAVTFNVLANDTDADGDALQVFDLVFDGTGEETTLLDGDLSNGELIQQTDPVTGFGTGIMTYVGAPDFIGDVTFSYIATDGEYQAGPVGVTITQTGLAPTLSDDVVVLTSDALANSAMIAFDALLENDTDADGDPLDEASLVLQDGRPVGPTGIELSPADLVPLAGAPIGPDGNGGEALAFNYTLTDSNGAGQSDPASLRIFVADPLDIADAGPQSMFEDGVFSFDISTLRSGGYGDLTIVEASATANGAPAGDVTFDDSRLTFLPLLNLADVVAVLEVSAIDAIGDTVEFVLNVGIDPLDDAPLVTILSPIADVETVNTDEDVSLSGTLSLTDVDLGAPLSPVNGILDTLNGGILALSPTAVPGVFEYTYSPAPDFAGSDRVTFDVVSPVSGAAVEQVTLTFEVAPINDAPVFVDGDFDFVLDIGATQTFSLFAGVTDVDSDIDTDSLEVVNSNPDAVSIFLEEIRDDDGVLTDIILSTEGRESGLASISYTVADAEGNRSAPVVLTVDVNTPPEANGDRAEVFAAGDTVLIDAIANDNDADGTISYVMGDAGVPVAIDPRVAFDDESQPGLLGSIAWSEADAAFLYTPPADPALFGQTDVFFYEIVDDKGAVTRGTVFIELFAEGDVAVRVAGATEDGAVVEATSFDEVFILTDQDTTVSGTVAELDGDKFIGFGEGSKLVFEDTSVIDSTVTTERVRDPAAPLVASEINDALSVDALLKNAPQDELIAAFVGSTRLEVTTSTGSGAVELSGVYLGDFTIEDGSLIVSYAPSLEGDGVLTGTDGDDDLRSRAGDDTLLGLEGDDLLRAGDGADSLDGGAGQDVLDGGAGENTLTGGAGADLFVLSDGAETDLLTDFNPYEGDRILISDPVFLTGDQNPDTARLSLQADGDSWLLIGDPNDEDVAEEDRVPLETLARFTIPIGLSIDDLSLSGQEDGTITGAFAGSAQGVNADLRLFSVETGALNGEVILDPLGDFVYTPNLNFVGTDSFVIRVTISTEIGELSMLSTVTVNVEPEDDLPVAADLAVSAAEDMPVLGQVTATDADGTQIFYTVSANPLNGALTLDEDGVFEYTPDPNFFGTDSFEFSATSGGQSDTGLVSIDVTPVNDAPVANDDANFTTESSQPLLLLSQDLLVNDEDVEGDALSVASVEGAVGGTVELVDEDILFTPDAGFLGTASFTYVASDGQALSNAGLVEIEVAGTGDPYADYFQGTDAGETLSVRSLGETKIFGAGGSDRLKGAASDDMLAGGEGNDLILGRRGDDVLNGDAGKDLIYGGNGNDLLDGGAGNDLLFGGKGSDVFQFKTGNGHDRIGDHTRSFFNTQSGTDLIAIDVDGIDTFADLLEVSSSKWFGTTFDFGDGDALTLEFVSRNDLVASDFDFI